jgi:hypothetical protein
MLLSCFGLLSLQSYVANWCDTYTYLLQFFLRVCNAVFIIPLNFIIDSSLVGKTVSDQDKIRISPGKIAVQKSTPSKPAVMPSERESWSVASSFHGPSGRLSRTSSMQSPWTLSPRTPGPTPSPRSTTPGLQVSPTLRSSPESKIRDELSIKQMIKSDQKKAALQKVTKTPMATVSLATATTPIRAFQPASRYPCLV